MNVPVEESRRLIEALSRAPRRTDRLAIRRREPAAPLQLGDRGHGAAWPRAILPDDVGHDRPAARKLQVTSETQEGMTVRDGEMSEELDHDERLEARVG